MIIMLLIEDDVWGIYSLFYNFVENNSDVLPPVESKSS